MSDNISSIISSLLSLISMSITVRYLIGVRMKRGLYLKTLFMLMLLIGLIFFTPYMHYSGSENNSVFQELLVYLGLIAPYFIFGFLIFDMKWKHGIIYILFYTFLESIILSMPYTFIVILNKKISMEFSIEQEYLFASLIMIVFFSSIAVFFNMKDRIPFQNMRIRSFILILILAYMDSNICAIIVVYMERKTTDFAYFLSLITVLFLMFQIFVIIYLMDALNIWKERNLINQKYLKLQEEHYEVLLEKDEEIRSFQHDISHHLNILHNLYLEGNQEELMAYKDKIDLLVKPTEGIVCTNNKIVDSIVNHFISEGDKLGVKINLAGRMPVQCHIDNFDLCTIFSNILSNALEATKGCQEKSIELGIRYDESRIYIKEENPYIRQILQKENALISQKKDARKHGIGLRNVKDSIKKYKGELLIDISQFKFKAMIMLENK